GPGPGGPARPEPAQPPPARRYAPGPRSVQHLQQACLDTRVSRAFSQEISLNRLLSIYFSRKARRGSPGIARLAPPPAAAHGASCTSAWWSVPVAGSSPTLSVSLACSPSSSTVVLPSPSPAR